MGDSGSGIRLSNTHLTGSLSRPTSDTDEISVLVTGFGPFKSNLVNASYLIASALPSSVTLTPSSDTAPSVDRRISIHVHPSPISVTYSAVRTSIPAILEDYVKTHGGRHPDVVIHMGIAATRNYYSVEVQAHRDAYHMSDNLGRAGFEDGEKLWRELDLPPVLKAGNAHERSTEPRLQPSATEADPTLLSSKVARAHLRPHPPNERLLRTWQSFAPEGADVRISEDAGRYLCEFIFYTSLALAFRENRDRSVAFLHVPGSCTDEDIEAGKEAAIALIKALVTCWL